MITPIEQSPHLVFDPARQQITPPPVVQPQPLPALTETPLQESTASNKQDSGSDSSSGDKAPEQQAQSQTAQKLRAAWAYLQQLKSEVSMALSGGYADNAKRAAQRAAEVASSIETLSMQIPMSGDQQVLAVNSWLPPSFVGMENSGGTDSSSAASPSSDYSAETETVSAVSLVDLARGGLGAAKEVIVEAASVSQFTEEDRTDINTLMQRVLNSMAVVEQIAARLPLEPGAQTVAVPNKVDFEA